jgi:hypothetical protein
MALAGVEFLVEPAAAIGQGSSPSATAQFRRAATECKVASRIQEQQSAGPPDRVAWAT